MAEEVHRNKNGVLFIVQARRGETLFRTTCPACKQRTTVSLFLNKKGDCSQSHEAVWSCGCTLVTCTYCTNNLRKSLKSSQQVLRKVLRFKLFCLHLHAPDSHYYDATAWEPRNSEHFEPIAVGEEVAGPSVVTTAPAGQSSDASVFGLVRFAAEKTAGKAMAPLEVRVASLEDWRKQKDPTWAGTGAQPPDSPPLGSGQGNAGHAPPSSDVLASPLHVEQADTSSRRSDDVAPLNSTEENWWDSMFGDTVMEDRVSLGKRPKTGDSDSQRSGAGHLAKGETPRDVQRLRELRDSDEKVEALVAARQVGGHFEISFDTSRALEKDSGWLLMVTGIHHIAFAARGDLDPNADDVFSVEDIGGIQRVISLQQKVAKEQRFMVPSGENDGTVLFMSTEEIAEQRLQRMVAGVRMGEVEDTCKGRRMAVCYSQAGFYSSEVVMTTIEDRASAERAVAEAWQEAASKRLDRLEQEMTARKGRCRELAEAAGAEKQETERMRQRMEEQRTGDTEGEEAVQLRDALALLERKMEKRLEEEQRQLARLEVAVKTERRSLAKRFRREIAEKEEVVRVMKLQEHQLQEELMAEKERRLLEKEQRDALQSDLAKKEAALQAAEVRLAATRSEKKAVEAARQEQTGAEAEVVRLRCELAQLTERVAQFEARATEAEAMAEAEEARVAALQQNLADEKEAAAEIKVALAALQSEMKVAAKEKEALSEALDAEKNASAEAQSETEQLKAEVAQLAAKVELHKDAVAALQLEKRAVGQEKNAVEQEKEALAAALGAEQKASAEKEQETAQLKVEVSQLAADVAQHQDAVATLQSEKEVVEQQKVALAAALDAATAEAKKETDQLKAEVVQLTADLAQQQDAAAALQSEKETVEQEKVALAAALDAATAEAKNETGQLRAEVAQLTADVAQQQDAAAALQSEKETVEQEKEAVHQEKEALAAQLAAQKTATAEAEATAAEQRTAAQAAVALLPEATQRILELHQAVLRLVEDAGEREEVRKALEGSVEELTVTLPNETEANGKDYARLYKLLLTQCPGLQKLCLDSETFGQSVKGLADGLEEHTGLQELALFGTVTDEAAKHLARAFEKNESLKEVCLGVRVVDSSAQFSTAGVQENRMGDSGAACLAKGLQGNTTVHTLRLGYTNIGDDGAKSLAPSLTNLQMLAIEECNIGDPGAKHLAGALQGNSTLRTLFLTRCNVGDKGAEHIATAFKQNRTLLNLALGGPNFGGKAAQNLAGALKNGTLLKLSLNGSIGVLGAQYLTKALMETGTLQELYLGNGNFGDEGALSLALALPQSAVQVLRMSNCGVGDAGAEGLADPLEENSSLQELHLWYSDVGDAGAGHLARALGRNGTLRELDLRGTKVGQEGADLLAAALQEKKGPFTRLLLPEENFDEEQRQHLRGIDARIDFI